MRSQPEGLEVEIPGGDHKIINGTVSLDPIQLIKGLVAVLIL